MDFEITIEGIIDYEFIKETGLVIDFKQFNIQQKI